MIVGHIRIDATPIAGNSKGLRFSGPGPVRYPIAANIKPGQRWTRLQLLYDYETDNSGSYGSYVRRDPLIPAGTTLSLPAGEAGSLIGRGFATWISDEDPPTSEAADLRIVLGIANDTDIVVNSSAGLNPAATVSVILSADYHLAFPAGWPSRPPAGSAQRNVITNGTTAEFLKPEADALVNASAAAYA